MKRWLSNWVLGLDCMFSGYAVSFYAYFSTILAEILFVWAFLPENALKFTLLLTACVINVCIISWLKKIWIGSRLELVFAIVYVVILIGIFIAGCFVDFWQNLLLFIIPILVALLWVAIRECQIIQYQSGYPKIVLFISRIFDNIFVYFLTQLILIAAPFGVVASFLYLTSFPNEVVILLAVLYGMFIPLVFYYEGMLIGSNIFELAYEVYWDKDFEKAMKELEKDFGEDSDRTKEVLIKQIEEAQKEIDKYNSK